MDKIIETLKQNLKWLTDVHLVAYYQEYKLIAVSGDEKNQYILYYNEEPIKTWAE